MSTKHISMITVACGLSQILLPVRCFGKVGDASKDDGDVTFYLHPQWPNLPGVAVSSPLGCYVGASYQ